MSGVRQRVDAFIAWAWDFVGSSRPSSIIDDPEAAQIDWGDEHDGDEGDDGDERRSEPRSEPGSEPGTGPPAEGQQTA
jgi:hypothetical protein